MVATIELTRTVLTVEGLLALNRDGREGELWEGEFVEVSPSGGPQGRICLLMQPRLNARAAELGVGEVWGTESGYIVDHEPVTILAPDLALVPCAHAETVDADFDGYHDVIPPLVVEVKSPTDREKEIAEKLALYLRAGVGEVWWVRPKERTLTRHWPDRTPVVLRLGDTVDEVEALPGFSMAVDDMFPPPAPASPPTSPE